MKQQRSVASRGGVNYLLFLGCLVVCFAPSLAGWAFPPGPWFESLQKPEWNPPNWLFGPVWTLLYFSMGVALYRVSRLSPSSQRKLAWVLFGLQLLLNAAWTPLFFGAQEMGWALLVLILLDVTLAMTLFMFWRVDRTAGLMLAPYLCWILFATVLNATLWRLNPTA